MAGLNTHRIAKAALAVADERGAKGFTIRAVADVLGVTPMALYHHVKDKTELVALMMDEVYNETPLAPLTDDWLEDLLEIARWTRASNLAHPAMIELRRQHRIYNAKSIIIAERWVNVWQRSGLNTEKAALAATTSSLAIVGLVAEQAAFDSLDIPSDEMLADVPDARALYHPQHTDRSYAFDLAVRALCEGLYRRLKQDD